MNTYSTVLLANTLRESIHLKTCLIYGDTECHKLTNLRQEYKSGDIVQ